MKVDENTTLAAFLVEMRRLGVESFHVVFSAVGRTAVMGGSGYPHAVHEDAIAACEAFRVKAERHAAAELGINVETVDG